LLQQFGQKTKNIEEYSSKNRSLLERAEKLVKENKAAAQSLLRQQGKKVSSDVSKRAETEQKKRAVSLLKPAVKKKSEYTVINKRQRKIQFRYVRSNTTPFTKIQSQNRRYLKNFSKHPKDYIEHPSDWLEDAIGKFGTGFNRFYLKIQGITREYDTEYDEDSKEIEERISAKYLQVSNSDITQVFERANKRFLDFRLIKYIELVMKKQP
jgi:hypothetical protein